MVRKHASRELKGNLTAKYGGWDKQRYVADLQRPLTEEATFAAVSWLAIRIKAPGSIAITIKTFFSGINDADLSDFTIFSLPGTNISASI
nr:hypothetical protein [Sodalis-like endosymbiont of Proechinophthirus fluctus]